MDYCSQGTCRLSFFETVEKRELLLCPTSGEASRAGSATLRSCSSLQCSHRRSSFYGSVRSSLQSCAFHRFSAVSFLLLIFKKIDPGGKGSRGEVWLSTPQVRRLPAGPVEDGLHRTDLRARRAFEASWPDDAEEFGDAVEGFLDYRMPLEEHSK